jgi:hypothetical protein
MLTKERSTMQSIVFAHAAAAIDYTKEDPDTGENGVFVNDPTVLCSLDGVEYLDEVFSDHFDESGNEKALVKAGVGGGKMSFRFNSMRKQLEVVTEYELDRKLTAEEIEQLADYTAGQWSDGIGENFNQLQIEGGLVPCVLVVTDRKNILVEFKELDPKVFDRAPKRSPIFDALLDGDVERVLALSESATHLNALNKWGSTPLMVAVTEGRTELAVALLERGSAVNHVARTGSTPLGIAAMMGNIQVGRALLERGANMDHLELDPLHPDDGMTALMWAVNRHQVMFVALLLEFGVDVKQANKEGQTAVFFADQETDEAKEIFVLLHR